MMKNYKAHKGKFIEWLLRMLFVALPAFLMSAYVLQNINLAYTGFESGTGGQFIAVASGIIISCTLAMYGARFIVFSLALVLLMYIGSVISSNAGGEFDQFYLSARYSLYSTLFAAGWLTGFLISRTRWYVVFYCVLLTIAFVIFFAKRENMDAGDLSLNLLPVFLYSMYMLFFAPGMLSQDNVSFRKTSGWLLRLFFVCSMFAFAFFMAKSQFKHENEIAEKIVAQKKQKGDKGDTDKGDRGDLGDEYNASNGMLERGGKPEQGEGNEGDKEIDGKGDKQQGKGNKGNADGNDGEGGFKLKDEMKMGEQQSQSDVLMFCARLDNYFPDGSPQPYYFVYHYLPKYDPLTETFVRDPLLKFNDEMRADPSKIGMYKTSRDSALIRPLKNLKERKVVEADVFISANVWKHSLLAPATPFSIQTIPVDTAYKGLFRSGYHVKSNVSELNNAYFVYNPSANPQLLAYQEERFEELRSIKDFSGMDSTWFRYYTDLPAGSLFDSIRNLTLAITASAITPADKVAAVRDYFMQTGPKGTRLYRYTLDPGAPGDPNIPTGNMLRNFLFRSHEGYCTYFAGASVLMLRSIGIPARFTTGFATVDRSDKNKGWYWFYASQAHAWTQVYFPEYGWMDFDMTIGNEERNNAPKPDGTPPVPPPQPWLIVEGIVNEEPDAASKSLSVRFSKIVFFNDEYQLKEEQTHEVNASLCRIVYGKKDTTFNAIHEGDTVFIVSWDDMAKDVPEPDPDLAIEIQVNRFEWPMIADEIYIIKKKTEVQPERKNEKIAQQTKTEFNWKRLLRIAMYSAACVVFLIFLFPFFWFVVLLNRARASKGLSDFAETNYRLSLYLFHMSGTEIKAETSLAFAQRADASYGTSFSFFVIGYLKLKYSELNLSEMETDGMKKYSSSFRRELSKSLSFKTAVLRWFNVMRAIRYFRTPEPSHQTYNENQSPD